MVEAVVDQGLAQLKGLSTTRHFGWVESAIHKAGGIVEDATVRDEAAGKRNDLRPWKRHGRGAFEER
jgi:hypothetical protein